MNHLLQTLTAPADWRAYHDIRRSVLWKERARSSVYREDVEDEYHSDNSPRLLVFQGQPIGTVRIDQPAGRDVAYLRLIAIRPEFRRQGHGRALMLLAEELIQRPEILINSAPDAVPFYEKLGYRQATDRPREHPQYPLMIKHLLL